MLLIFFCFGMKIAQKLEQLLFKTSILHKLSHLSEATMENLYEIED